MLADTLEYVHEVIVRVDVVQPACGQQALHNADMLGTQLSPTEEPGTRDLRRRGCLPHTAGYRSRRFGALDKGIRHGGGPSNWIYLRATRAGACATSTV